MSKHNKANRNNYMQAGRLSPDEMARERKKMRTDAESDMSTERVTGKPQEERRAQASSRPRTERE